MGKRRRNRRRNKLDPHGEERAEGARLEPWPHAPGPPSSFETAASPPPQDEGGTESELGAKALIIREATIDDADALFDFLLRVAPQSGRLLAEIDAEKSLHEITRVLTEPAYGYALLAFAGDLLVGSIGVIYVDWWYSAESFFAERWLFADPAHGEAGAALLAEADAIARNVGAPLIVDVRQRRKRDSAIVFVQQRAV